MGNVLESLLSRNLSRDTRQSELMKLNEAVQQGKNDDWLCACCLGQWYRVGHSYQEPQRKPYPSSFSWVHDQILRKAFLASPWLEAQGGSKTGWLYIHWSSPDSQRDDPDHYNQVSKRHGQPLTDLNLRYVHQIFKRQIYSQNTKAHTVKQKWVKCQFHTSSWNDKKTHLVFIILPQACC